MNIEKSPLNSIKNRDVITLTLSISAFISALVVSSITASKLYSIPIFGWSIDIPVGTSLFAITFLATDLIGELYGSKWAKATVSAGLIVRIATLAFIVFAVNIPGVDYWTNQESYSSVLLSTWRILLAGIVVYPISQFTDVTIFHFLKERHEGKHMLWARNIFSTSIAQVIDSTLFVLVAFAGVLPTSALISVIVGQITIKIIISLADTPFVYMLRNIVQRRRLFDLRD